MACTFRFRGRIERKLSEVEGYYKAYQNAVERPTGWYVLQELKGEGALPENCDRPGYAETIQQAVLVDTLLYEIGDIVNLLEMLDWDGEVLYRDDEMDVFQFWRFNRVSKTVKLSIELMDV